MAKKLEVVHPRDGARSLYGAAAPEPQFEPMWTSWDDADRSLTFDREREWVRRALADLEDGSVV